MTHTRAPEEGPAYTWGDVEPGDVVRDRAGRHWAIQSRQGNTITMEHEGTVRVGSPARTDPATVVSRGGDGQETDRALALLADTLGAHVEAAEPSMWLKCRSRGKCKCG